jgi:hypothetical protein
MAWTTLAKVKNELGIASGDTSIDSRLGQWLTQAHWLLVKEITQETGNLIEAISVANPTVIQSRGHGYLTGTAVNISGSNSTPSIDGQQTVAVIDEDTFSVPVNVTVAGTRGWINRVYQNQYYSGDGTKFLALRQRPVLSVQELRYDANGYFGKTPAPATPFDSSTVLVEGTDWVLVVDDDRYGFSERGHVARINSYWTKPNERVRGVLVSMPGNALGNIKISYTAGYPLCPIDLQGAENQMVAILKAAAGRGLPVTSESLDYYQYQLAGQADAVKMLGGIYRTMANYKAWRM